MKCKLCSIKSTTFVFVVSRVYLCKVTNNTEKQIIREYVHYIYANGVLILNLHVYILRMEKNIFVIRNE